MAGLRPAPDRGAGSRKSRILQATIRGEGTEETTGQVPKAGQGQDCGGGLQQGLASTEALGTASASVAWVQPQLPTLERVMTLHTASTQQLSVLNLTRHDSPN